MDQLTRSERLPLADDFEADGRTVVLIVDDFAQNLAVLGEILLPYYKVRVANSGAAALIAAHQTPQPALILLDVMMPLMDGYEVLARLRAHADTADLPVIFVTARDHTEDETRGLELGAIDYLTKPLHAGLTLARVRGHLERRAAQQRIMRENAWLEAEVSRRTEQIRRIRDVSIRILASMAEARDQETGEHIVRTQAYVRLLAEEMARSPLYRDVLSADLVETITNAAPLHDIGKIGIPDDILQKPGRLDAAEWEVMQTHCRLGADALQRGIRLENDHTGLDFLYVAIEIAHYHHEKWDGSGYPMGLLGEAIPLPARLMALADVFDALITSRVYKGGYDFEQAVAIIREGRGVHFDPAVVDAFEAQLPQFRDIAAQRAGTVAGEPLARGHRLSPQ